MKGCLSVSCAIILAISFFFIGEILSAAPIELKWANYFPVTSMQTKICEDFIRDIEAKTQGKVKFSYFTAGTLLTAPKMYDGVVEGISDIGLSNLSYTYGRFKVTEVLDLPLGYPNAWVSNHVANDFIKKFKPKEWENVHILSMHTSPVNVMMTASKPVRKMEDLKGLNVRAQGYIAEVASALGATPRAIPTPETYDAVVKKVVDGIYIPMETLRAFRYAEVIKHITECWPIGQVFTFYLIMNKNSWNKLPDDVKKVFNEYPFEEKLAITWNEIDIDGKKFGMEKGVNFIQLPADEGKRWVKASESVIEKYVKSMVSGGYSEKEVREWITFIKERIDYWTKKQREMKIKSSTGPDDIRLK